MRVVLDTSPPCYLVLIKQVEILPEVFSEILVPAEVLTELAHPGAPAAVRAWAAATPPWLKRVDPRQSLTSILPSLDPGERAAIGLALESEADFVVFDDRKARNEALALGLDVTGLLGVIGFAAEKRLIDIEDSIRKLKATHFFVHPAILRDLLERFGPST